MVFSGFSPELFHDHDDHADCHAEHQPDEVDSCHLAIYHHEYAQHCKDHDHLTAHSQHCDWCDLYAQHLVQLDFSLQQNLAVEVQHKVIRWGLAAKHTGDFQNRTSARGPPSLA